MVGGGNSLQKDVLRPPHTRHVIRETQKGIMGCGFEIKHRWRSREFSVALPIGPSDHLSGSILAHVAGDERLVTVLRVLLHLMVAFVLKFHQAPCPDTAMSPGAPRQALTPPISALE